MTTNGKGHTPASRQRARHAASPAASARPVSYPIIGIPDSGEDIGPLPLDEVFDDADVAQHAQLREIAEVQQRARMANQPERDPSFDGKHCVECRCNIPPKRLAMGKVRCVDCQEDLDRDRAYAHLR